MSLPAGSTPIVYMKFGSHLYGTNTPESDTDYKGVFIPSPRDVLLGRIPKTIHTSTGNPSLKNTPKDVDVEWFSLHQFLKLACEGQTVAIDMLHAPLSWADHYTDEWHQLHVRRHGFHTKNLKAFVGYARRQAAKYGIKGSRLAAVREVIAVLEKEDPSAKLWSVLHKVPMNEYCYPESTLDLVKHIGVLGQLPCTGRHFYTVCGRKLEITISITTALEPLRKFEENYGARAEQAARNEGIDWKAVSHAIRAAIELRSLFMTGEIVFPLMAADYLLKIKRGELDYLTVVGPRLEALMEELEDLAKNSKLPQKVDRRYWDDWLIQVMTK